MATEKDSRTNAESPTEQPSFNGKLEEFSYDDPRRARRSPGLSKGAETTPSADLKPASPAPKRKAGDIRSFLTAGATTPSQASSSTSSPPGKRARREVKGKKSPGYAPPEKYAHLNLLPDTLEDGLLCAFVGLNPGIMTAARGHAYAHPSNLFWKLLHTSGLTPRRFHPTEDRTLPALCSLGNTNIVARPTRDQSELSKSEMDDSVDTLVAKLLRFKPEAVCIVGKGIWESMFRTKYGRPLARKEFKYGWQGSKEDIGCTRVFVATSTSGLAASLTLEEKEAIWKELGDWVQMRRAERVLRAVDVKLEESATLV
ncbi:MAG: hypothetical protein M1840_002508 [Geoglossum simile]|nr:MAG: hypothetical protein M1840_002508 [Geoglossum simile]